MFFQALTPILAHAKLNLMITAMKDEKINIVLIPTPNTPDSLLTKAMTFTGTAAELDAQLLDQLFEMSNDYADLATLIAQQKEELKQAKVTAAKVTVKASAPKAETPPKDQKQPVTASSEPQQSPIGNDADLDDESDSATSLVVDTHTLSLF